MTRVKEFLQERWLEAVIILLLITGAVTAVWNPSVTINIRFSDEFYVLIPTAVAGILLCRAARKLHQTDPEERHDVEHRLLMGGGLFGVAFWSGMLIFWPKLTGFVYFGGCVAVGMIVVWRCKSWILHTYPVQEEK